MEHDFDFRWVFSAVTGRELTFPLTSASNVSNASSFKIFLHVLRSAFRKLLAVLIYCFQTPPPAPPDVIWCGWVSDASYPIGSICLQILWYLIMIYLLKGFSKLVNSTNKVGVIVGSHQMDVTLSPYKSSQRKYKRIIL